MIKNSQGEITFKGSFKVLVIFMFVAFLGYQLFAFQTTFTNPTPGNVTSQIQTNVLINASINTSNLEEVIYNWNGTNFTIYNGSLFLMMNFDNVSVFNENNTGNHTEDISGNANHGTCAMMGAGCNWTTGVYGTGVSFDGTNDYLDTDLRLNGGTDIFSVSFWFKTDITSTDQEVVLQWGNSPSEQLFRFHINGIVANRMSFRLRKDDDTNSDISALANLVAGTWYHAFGTYNGSHQEFYLDGVL